MNELLHIIQREYLTRVRTKTFIVITLLAPLFMSSLFLLPVYFAGQQEDYRQLRIGLADSSHLFGEAFDESELAVERLTSHSVEHVKTLILSNEWEGIIYVEKSDSIGTNIQYYSRKQPGLFLINQIRSAMQRVVVNEKLAVYGIENAEELVRSVRSSVSVESIRVEEKTETKSSPYQQPLCMGLGLTIYMFVLLFSSQTMRGVLEEKSSRIVEIIITSVSPVKFMAGKIIGIALLGLTQIVCWIILLYGFSLLLSNFADVSSSGGSMNNMMNQRISQEDVNQILNNLNLIDFNTILPAFVFFFIGGYLLYASIFAAIAATANHSDDIQRTTSIVTLPLILSVIILSNTVNSPDSSLSYWFSMIPFTSPVVMMGRIVYGAPIQDILLSMFLLAVAVVLIIWLSGKIYQTAILYTGKKVSGKDILSWIKNIKQ